MFVMMRPVEERDDLEASGQPSLTWAKRVASDTTWTPHELFFLLDVFTGSFADGAGKNASLSARRLAAYLSAAGGVHSAANVVAERLIATMDVNALGGVSFQDFVVFLDTIARVPVREHLTLLWRYLGPRVDAKTCKQRLSGLFALWTPALDGQVTALVSHAASVEQLLAGYASFSDLAAQFSHMLLGSFVPIVRDMHNKLKKSTRNTLHAHAFFEYRPGGPACSVPAPVETICASLALAHEKDPEDHIFALEDMRDQRSMVEAIVNGVQVSHNPNDWAGVGVPYLLLSLRVLLRNYHEAVLTQHISSQLAVFLAQEPRGPQREQRLVAFFKTQVALLPPVHRATLVRIVDLLHEVSTASCLEAQWLELCSTVLGNCLANTRTVTSPCTPDLERATEVLVRRWALIRPSFA